MLAELVLRLWLAAPNPWRLDPELGPRLTPGAVVLQSREGYGRVPVDEHGWPDQPLPGPVEHRILLLGDSFTAGHEVGYGRRFSERLEQRLPGVELHNTGIGRGYPPFYAAVAQRAEPGRYDAVVVQLGDGDLFELDREDRIAFVRGGDGELELRQLPFPDRRSQVQRALGWLARHSALAEQLRDRLRRLAVQEQRRLRAKFGAEVAGGPMTGGALKESLPADLDERLDFFHEQLAPWHGRVLYLYLPKLEYDGPRVAPAFPEHARILREFAARHGSAFVDAGPALARAYQRTGQPLSGFANSRPGQGHLNAAGHAAVADTLAPHLRGRLP